ncbi:hypothetical protein A167_02834 [Alcanivorax sp. S71-1-4]|nr:hypothetical protein A167_02834 [Alcanivorax sp. S71-1-4]
MSFIRKSLVGGLVILLPLAVVGFFFRWIYSIVTDITSPVATLFIRSWGWPQYAADLIGIVVLVTFCFLLGNLVTTRLGGWLWQRTEDGVMARLPGYRAVREVVAQLLGNSEDSPFARGEVARVWLYGRDVEVSVLGLITSRFSDGQVSVFVPTGPNPTTGFIYIVDMSVVTLCPDIKVEQMMKVVVACGAGSHRLFPGGAAPAATPVEER